MKKYYDDELLDPFIMIYIFDISFKCGDEVPEYLNFKDKIKEFDFIFIDLKERFLNIN